MEKQGESLLISHFCWLFSSPPPQKCDCISMLFIVGTGRDLPAALSFRWPGRAWPVSLKSGQDPAFAGPGWDPSRPLHEGCSEAALITLVSCIGVHGSWPYPGWIEMGRQQENSTYGRKGTLTAAREVQVGDLMAVTSHIQLWNRSLSTLTSNFQESHDHPCEGGLILLFMCSY